MGVGGRGQTNLVIERRRDGEFSALIAKGIATKSYLGFTEGVIRARDFTGVALFYDWEENFLFGYQYRKGKIGGYIRGQDGLASINGTETDASSTNFWQTSSPSQYNQPEGRISRRMPVLYIDIHSSSNGDDNGIINSAAIRQQICFTLITNFYQQVTVGNTTFPPQLIRTDVQNVCWDPHLVEEIDWIAPEPGGTGYIDTTTHVDLTTQWQWPINPVDGQTVNLVNIYGETVTFVYSSELQGWNAMSMQYVISDSRLASNITNRPPQFGAGILLAMSGPALAEPTPVGEIVVAGTAIVLGAIWLVRMADYLIEETWTREQIRKECTKLYVQCYYKYEFTKPCATCQQYCMSNNGTWDDYNCPLP